MKQNGFAGVMVWALDLDDFSNMCGQGKYPLMNTINQELLGRMQNPVRPRPYVEAFFLVVKQTKLRSAISILVRKDDSELIVRTQFSIRSVV